MSAAAGKPDDFDWVSARKACDYGRVFEALLGAARRAVDQMIEERDGRKFNRFQVTSGDRFFTVSRSGDIGQSGMRFVLGLEPQGIRTEPYRVPAIKSMVATLTLNDDGDCRLLVDGAELQEWQFMKRALEPLLFGEYD